MSSYSDYPEGTGCSRRAWGIGLLLAGLIGMALAEGIVQPFLHSPRAWQDNANMGSFIIPFYLIIISSLLVLISLFLLKIPWLLAIGAILLALLAAYGQGWLFPTDPTTPDATANWYLTYGSGVIVLSLILVVSVAVVKGKSSKMPK